MSCFCIRRVWKEVGWEMARAVISYHASVENDAESYPFVPELQKWRKYRGAIIMKNFKIIYFYNEEKDILWLVDLWDLRQNPRKLNLRARRIERKEYH